MPTGPPPPSALLSPLWQHEHAADGRECWRHRATGELSYERPAPVLYPVVRFVGKKRGQPGRVKLLRPEPFERHIYLKGTLTRTQAQPASLCPCPCAIPLGASSSPAQPTRLDPAGYWDRLGALGDWKKPAEGQPTPHTPYSTPPDTPHPTHTLGRCHSRSHGRSRCTRRRAPPSTTCTSTWTVALPMARPTSPSPARAPHSA